MRYALIAMLTFAATPVAAVECAYVSGFDFGTVRFVGEDTVVMDTYFNDGAETCDYFIGAENSNSITCASGFDEAFSFASATLGGGGDELLVLLDHVWYRQCQ